MYGASPVVCVFTRTTSEPLTSLVKQVDAAIAKNSSLKSFVVYLTDDPDKDAATLKSLAAECGLKSVPLTITDDVGGPPSYRLSPDAEVTVLMWRGGQVKVNHAFAPGQLTTAEVDVILADLPKILGN